MVLQSRRDLIFSGNGRFHLQMRNPPDFIDGFDILRISHRQSEGAFNPEKRNGLMFLRQNAGHQFQYFRINFIIGKLDVRHIQSAGKRGEKFLRRNEIQLN